MEGLVRLTGGDLPTILQLLGPPVGMLTMMGSDHPEVQAAYNVDYARIFSEYGRVMLVERHIEEGRLVMIRRPEEEEEAKKRTTRGHYRQYNDRKKHPSLARVVAAEKRHDEPIRRTTHRIKKAGMK